MRRITENFSVVIKNIAKSPFTYIALGLYSLYWLFAAVFPLRPMLEGSSALVLIVGLAIFLTWFPSFLIGIANGARVGSWQLPIAIVLTWLGLNEKHAWGFFWRVNDMPEWMMNSHFIGQANWIVFLSGLLYIISPGNETGTVPVKNWYLVIGVVGIGMFLAGSIVTAIILHG